MASSGKQEQPDELCNQGHSVGIRHNPCLQSFISGKQGQAQVVRSTVRVRTVSEEAMAERLQAGDATRWLHV